MVMARLVSQAPVQMPPVRDAFELVLASVFEH